MKRILMIVLAVAVIGGLYYLWNREGGNGRNIRYRKAAVERGEVTEGVQQSGAVQPVVLVQVGTQISGVIDKIFVDFNSKVKAGETIALIDPKRLQAQIAQDGASVARAKADVERVRAQLVQAEKDLARQKTLAAQKFVGQSDLDAAIANADSLKAQIGVAEAVVAQAEAQLAQDRVNLDYCTIVSPVDGVVVARNVDVGQTVAASLQAPTLFLIANDLTKVQVQVSVPEADIGKIHDGARATFNVDAHPTKIFEGRVSQVRLAATNLQNVVTYTVIVDAENPDGLLFPGMTANVTFEVARSAPDALRVPAAALRLRVPVELVEGGRPSPDAALAEGVEPKGSEAKARATGAGEPKGSEAKGGARRGHGREGFVYVTTAGGLLRPIAVWAGISDGTLTAVRPIDKDALKEGTEVVTAILTDDESATRAATNPFMPSFPRRRGGGGGPH